MLRRRGSHWHKRPLNPPLAANCARWHGRCTRRGMPSTLQLLVSALLCGLSAACASRSDTRLVLPSGPGVTPQEQAAVQPVEAEPLPPQDADGYRNYFLPVVEIVGMDAILNLAGRRIYEPETFQVSTASIRRNLRGPWVVDEDPFQVNQFGHPYQGAMYHTIARSTGHGFWTSMSTIIWSAYPRRRSLR